MLNVITDSKKIEDLQNQFKYKLKSAFDEKFIVKLGHKGRDFKDNVLWSNDLKLWVCFRGPRKSRYWNGFGTEKPKNDSHLSITCEINFPVSGLDRRIQGVFLQQDELENYYIGHRGKIGGGRKGIGKKLFIEQYKGDLTFVNDNDVLFKIVLVGNMGIADFPIQIKEFVHEVKRIKNLV
jgi:hypothetical protein